MGEGMVDELDILRRTAACISLSPLLPALNILQFNSPRLGHSPPNMPPAGPEASVRLVWP